MNNNVSAVDVKALDPCSHEAVVILAAPTIPWRKQMGSFDVFPRLLEAAAVSTNRRDSRAGKAMRNFAHIVMPMLLLCAVAFAQVDRGQIEGTVTDESGAVVPG